MKRHFAVRAAAAASLLGLGMALAPSLSGRADADISICRTDPVIVLSNGTTVDMTATVGDVAADIQGISYTLHAPAGTSVLAVYTTPGAVAAVEALTFQADNPAGTYTTSTLVTTGHSVAVSATTAVVGTGRTGHGTASGAVSGSSGSPLTVQVSITR